MKTILTIALAGTLLAGCAGRYVPLYVVPKPDPTKSVEERVSGTLSTLYDFGNKFSATYGKASREADLAQVPLIGAAVALGLIAVNQPTNAAETVAKIGIGTGVYAAGRSLATPSGGPEPFRKGVMAINCVLLEGAHFVRPGLSDRVAALSQDTVDLDTLTGQLSADAETEVNDDGATDDLKKSVRLAKANAKLAVARSEQASVAARTQLGAYEKAPDEFERATSTIVAMLASKSAVFSNFDPSALAASWTKAEPTEDAEGAQSLVDSRLGDYIAKLNGSSEQINRLAARVRVNANGFQFDQRLKAVAACPLQI